MLTREFKYDTKKSIQEDSALKIWGQADEQILLPIFIPLSFASRPLIVNRVAFFVYSFSFNSNTCP